MARVFFCIVLIKCLRSTCLVSHRVTLWVLCSLENHNSEVQLVLWVLHWDKRMTTFLALCLWPRRLDQQHIMFSSDANALYIYILNSHFQQTLLVFIECFQRLTLCSLFCFQYQGFANWYNLFFLCFYSTSSFKVRKKKKVKWFHIMWILKWILFCLTWIINKFYHHLFTQINRFSKNVSIYSVLLFPSCVR